MASWVFSLDSGGLCGIVKLTFRWGWLYENTAYYSKMVASTVAGERNCAQKYRFAQVGEQNRAPETFVGNRRRIGQDLSLSIFLLRRIWW